MIEDLLASRRGLAPIDIAGVYPPAAGSVLDGTLQTLPGRDATAGFFIAGAVLR